MRGETRQSESQTLEIERARMVDELRRESCSLRRVWELESYSLDDNVLRRPTRKRGKGDALSSE